jgi:hypothetical protein
LSAESQARTLMMCGPGGERFRQRDGERLVALVEQSVVGLRWPPFAAVDGELDG